MSVSPQITSTVRDSASFSQPGASQKEQDVLVCLSFLIGQNELDFEGKQEEDAIAHKSSYYAQPKHFDSIGENYAIPSQQRIA